MHSTEPDGSLVFAGTAARSSWHLVRLSRHGRSFLVESKGKGRVLVLGGEPIKEPVAGRGPFVMNTRQEIARAIEDFEEGKFGSLE